jgi:hypothetical protein
VAFPTNTLTDKDVLLNARLTRMRFGVSDMSLHRWMNDPRLNFPRPIRINDRRYWRLSDLENFELERASQSDSPPEPLILATRMANLAIGRTRRRTPKGETKGPQQNQS